MSSDQLDEILHSFLEKELPGTEELTENKDIFTYILGALDQDIEDIDEDVIKETISAYCSIFSDLPEVEKQQLVRRLISQVSSHRLQQQQPGQPADINNNDNSNQPTTSLIAACLSQIKIHASSSSSSDGCSSSSEVSTPTADQQQALRMLRELLPVHLAEPVTIIPNEYLLHILRLNHNNRETTASWILEQQQSITTNTNATTTSSLVEKVDTWRQQLQEKELQAAAAKKEKEETRKQIVQKYALQVVPDGTTSRTTSSKGLLPPPMKIKSSAGESSSAKVRYREGVVVSRKNEKYIVEKIGEDWDGGSKGKVYTKGKRGKGFV